MISYLNTKLEIKNYLDKYIFILDCERADVNKTNLVRDWHRVWRLDRLIDEFS